MAFLAETFRATRDGVSAETFSATGRGRRSVSCGSRRSCGRTERAHKLLGNHRTVSTAPTAFFLFFFFFTSSTTLSRLVGPTPALSPSAHFAAAAPRYRRKSDEAFPRKCTGVVIHFKCAIDRQWSGPDGRRRFAPQRCAVLPGSANRSRHPAGRGPFRRRIARLLVQARWPTWRRSAWYDRSPSPLSSPPPSSPPWPDRPPRRRVRVPRQRNRPP